MLGTRRFSVGSKLFAGFGIVIILGIAVGVVGIINLGTMDGLTTRMYTKELFGTRYVGDIRTAAANNRLATLQFISTSDPAARALQSTRRQQAEADFVKARDALQPVLYTPEGQSLLSQIDAAWSNYKAASDQAVVSTTGAQAALDAAGVQYDTLNALLNQLSGLKSRLSAGEATNAQQTYGNVRIITIALLLAVVIFGIAAALWIARSITSALRATALTAALIAEGDLSQTVVVRSNDEVGDLAVAFNLMVGGLREMVREIRDGAQSLAAAASEIAASVTQQGSSTAEQAAAVNQTTATVDEVRVTGQQATQKAQAVATMAQRAAEVAAEGLETVEATITGMGELRSRVEAVAEQILALSEQTQQVGAIIATVEDLADQSNLLAVNAAVEAARAGDQGLGFAVVAQEVRRLAERSKTATVQVRTILTDIQRATNAAVLATEQGTKGAESGAQLVERAGHAIRQLAATIHESAESAQLIVASVGQQSAGMDQIAVAMANINQATADTAAGARQLQKAADNLNALAQRLTGLVNRYQPDGRVRVASYGV